MIVFLDSSVVLRVVLGQKGALKQWPDIVRGVASGLLEVECLRTIDRLRHAGHLDDAETARRREALYRLVAMMELVEPTMPVLRRASQPLPTPLGTLDAIHLATAALWQEATSKALTFATHDQALGLAARASGLPVIGV